MVNNQFFESINDFVFISRKQVFHHIDVVLYHPGHFPELNKKISTLYEIEGFKKLMIPTIYNKFLKRNEYEYHSKILIDLGIPKEVIIPIRGNYNSVEEIVSGAIKKLSRNEKNILLAGKSFFCKRFLLLATLSAREDQIFDVYPLEDDRGINQSTWYLSDKGITRVLNEVKEINKIINKSEELVRKYKESL